MELFDRANELQLNCQFQEAAEIYDALLTQNPVNAGLLATAGTNYTKMGCYGLAISMLTRASEELKESDIFCNLAVAYKFSGQYKKALVWFEKASQHNPTASSLANYAGMFLNIGTPEKAIDLSRKAIAIEPDHAIAHWNMGMALLECGEWEEGWKAHEWGFKAKLRVDRKIGDIPVWDGTNGKTIVVYGEQGLGDEIMFASMIPDLQADGNTVILESSDRLKTLFEKSFPGIVCYGTRGQPETPWLNDHKIDARISIGSLGQYYRNKTEDFPGTPYLKADALPKGEKFRVGISWTGGKKEGRIRTRQVPLSWWRSILNNDCEFVSLQYTDSEADLDAVNNIGGYSIQQFPEAKANDLYETAKLVQSCDLVISVCTTIIHMAGALGVPCWCMVPNRPAWRYGIKGPMRWYRSVRLYRQPAGEDASWMPVVARVGLDLNDRLDAIAKEGKIAYG